MPAPEEGGAAAAPGAIPRHEWATRLQEFTQAHAGRPTTLEVDDPSLGAQEQEREYRLQGVAYDHRDDRVEIMLGGFEGVGDHLARSIGGPEALYVMEDDEGREAVLKVAHAGGQTLLRLSFGS